MTTRAALLLLTFTLLCGTASAQTLPDLSGTWLGTLNIATKMRIVFNLSTTETGYSASMDSPDQGAKGIPVSEVVARPDTIRLVVAVARGEYVGVFDEATGTIRGRWKQSGMSLPLDLERTEEMSSPQRPQEPKPPFPYRSEDVTFENRSAGISLAGTLTLPADGAPSAAVVLVSGSGPQNRNEELLGHKPFLVLADHLTRAGIAVLRYDDRGVAQSGGDFSSATSEDLTGDALSAVAYLATRPEIDGSRIGIAGHSEGGLIAPMASVRSQDVSFIVLLAGPGIPGDEIILLQSELIGRAAGLDETILAKNRSQQLGYFEILKSEKDPSAAADKLRALMMKNAADMTPEEMAFNEMKPEDLEAAIDGQVAQLNGPWFRYFLRHDPAPVLERVRVPVLAVIGTKDLQVPYRENLEAIEAALKKAGNDRATVKALDGLNHLFQTADTGAPSEYATIEETMAPLVLDAVTEWILTTTGTRSGR